MNRTKLLCTTFAVLIASVASGFCQQPGRFQIVTGTVQHENRGEEKVILKIDTVTGVTWKYIGIPMNLTGHNLNPQELQDASLLEGWTKLTDEPGEELTKMQRQIRDAKTKAASPQKAP